MIRGFGEHVCRHWDQPDSGIWEPREAADHHTLSRVMSWLALERLLELRELGVMPRIPHERFALNRELIRKDIEHRAWNPELQAYTSTLGGGEVDASLLLMSWYGYAPAQHPRLRSTHKKIVERLGAGPGLLYRTEQSVRKGEGAFGICSFWLTEYLSRGGGSLEEAERLFRESSSYANEVGLFSEEVDPETGMALGNFPQAFTHIGLIGAALSLEERRREDARKGRPASARPEEAAHT
jgi:GH15 family glucan-1,4-alpha-glucosidase